MGARQKLVDLDVKHQELDALVEKSKHLKCEAEGEQVVHLYVLTLEHQNRPATISRMVS